METQFLSFMDEIDQYEKPSKETEIKLVPSSEPAPEIQPMPKKETVLFCGGSFFSLRVIDMAFFDTGEII